MALTLHSTAALRCQRIHNPSLASRRQICCKSSVAGCRFTPQSLSSWCGGHACQSSTRRRDCVPPSLSTRRSARQQRAGLRAIVTSASTELGDLGAGNQLLPDLFSGVATFDDEAAGCLRAAYTSARQTHSSISTQHLLYGLLTSRSQSIQPFLKQLQEFGITAESIQQDFPDEEQSMWGEPVLDKEAAWLLCGLACRPCEQISGETCFQKGQCHMSLYICHL